MKTPLALAVALALAAPAADAQVTASRGLTFGTVISGTTTSVAPTSANAAAFNISAILGIGGSVALTLPTTLTRVGGGATMPVSFCSTCAIYRVNNTNPVGGVAFDPKLPLTSLTIVVLSSINIWVGGSVSPPLNQAPGSYSGTMVLTIYPIL